MVGPLFIILQVVIWYWYAYAYAKEGVATFVQGTVIQGDHGPRGQMFKGQLSKATLVQGNFFPRKLLPVTSLLKLFFLFSIEYYDLN